MKKCLLFCLVGLCCCDKVQTPSFSQEFIQKEMIGAYLGGKVTFTVFVDNKIGNNSLVIEYSISNSLENSAIESLVQISGTNSNERVYSISLDWEPETVYYYKYHSKSAVNAFAENEIRQIKTAATKPSKYLTFTSTIIAGTGAVALEKPMWYEKSDGYYSPVFYYSYDAKEWTLWNPEERVECYSMHPVYICGGNRKGLYDGLYYKNNVHFYSDFLLNCSGDIMSLLDMNNDMSIIPAEYCFKQLFKGFPLKTAPALPAIELTTGCYSGMFSECRGLTKAPVLPAKVLQNDCYNSMFSGCENLSYVRCLAEHIDEYNNTLCWLLGVSSSGVFEKAASSNWATGISGIPEKWEVKSIK